MISHVEVMQEVCDEAQHAHFHMWKWCKKCVMMHDFTCGSDARVCDCAQYAQFHMWKWCKKCVMIYDPGSHGGRVGSSAFMVSRTPISYLTSRQFSPRLRGEWYSADDRTHSQTPGSTIRHCTKSVRKWAITGLTGTERHYKLLSPVERGQKGKHHGDQLIRWPSATTPFDSAAVMLLAAVILSLCIRGLLLYARGAILVRCLGP